MNAVEILTSREKVGLPKFLVFIIAALAVMAALLHFYTGWFSQIDSYIQRLLCLTLLLVLTFFYYPMGRKSWSDKLNRYFIVDLFYFTYYSYMCLCYR